MSSCGESSWKAGQNSSRRRRNLDESGLEILGCRHAIAQASLSMHRGEIYGYAHYLQTNYLIPNGAEYIWYDVVCMYWPWLLKNGSDTVAKMKPALSVMHAKAHSWSCQVAIGYMFASLIILSSGGHFPKYWGREFGSRTNSRPSVAANVSPRNFLPQI